MIILLSLLKLLIIDNGLAIGSRHITVSTCGIVPKIIEFADFPYQVNLAISLHSADNKIRDSLMPINKAYDLDTLKEALLYYSKKTNRRITIEYILIDGVNDGKEDAYKLIKYLEGINCYVNLIPYNETSSSQFKRSKESTIKAFYDIINLSKIRVTIRREFGGNISAACGQLSSKEEK